MGGGVKRAVKAVATGGLSEILSSSKPQSIDAPAAVTPAAPPTIDEARLAAEKNDMLRKRRGRASTILSGQSGDTANVNVGTKTLLGG